ncbi:S1C family serine protease [Echinicola vietnamensis]|uniref:Trypsin-like serine protease with C-terminal PDZ domain n=1 Tax=Echinicola vietnamensis (strain DSM 17526 / LMG 23754 / KMM 6221) TaxID=926556 RepID=L0G7K7_ECHVK|nr:trypsin-like peptidase domain-containing protein [Echinicola vietnamensis]AGA80840.1 trypsin-like serine protease with C-terminal PDZ domain [Echinicola vietnamensis DSM 17526]
MQKSFTTFMLAFVAGLLGAWTYQQFFLTDLSLAGHPSADTQFTSHQINNFTESNAPTTSGKANGLPVSFVEASERSTESVVFIKNFSGTDYRRYSIFDYFFGPQGGSPQRVSTGSGVIFSEDGYIITNNHVVEDAETLEVIHQKKTYKAKLIGTDPNTDIAVLKVDAEGLPAIKKGSSRDLQIGEWVIAVGNPFNLTSTVTAGIVSAKERQINILGGDFPLESFIQTDAAINPGNSGGALVNVNGELVGINTAILSKTGTYTGYGFAVPVDIAAKIANDLINYGEVQKAIPGVSTEEITPEIAEKMGLESLDGVIVNHIIRNGAAEKAGMEVGDIIIGIDDTEVNGKGSFEEALSYHYPGDQVTLRYLRENKQKRADITLQNLQGGTGVIEKAFFSSALLGAKLEAVNTVDKDRYEIDYGVKITALTRGYLSELGLGNGFILTEVNGEPAEDPDEIGTFLEEYSGRLVLEGITPRGRVFRQSYSVR